MGSFFRRILGCSFGCSPSALVPCVAQARHLLGRTRRSKRLGRQGTSLQPLREKCDARHEEKFPGAGTPECRSLQNASDLSLKSMISDPVLWNLPFRADIASMSILRTDPRCDSLKWCRRRNTSGPSTRLTCRAAHGSQLYSILAWVVGAICVLAFLPPGLQMS